VQVGVLYDGPGDDDTQRYILHGDGRWEADQASLAEADMGEMETLRDFIRWGNTTFASDSIALALVGPANGVVGFGQDKHGAEAEKVSFLTPIEVRTALQAALDGNGRKLDLIYFDGSSFGLLEDAAIVEGLANFVIVSPDTSLGVYPYDQYRRAAPGADPRAFALRVAQHYAENSVAHGLPYIVSVFDLAQFQSLQTATGQLGENLATYVQADVVNRWGALGQLRNSLRKYDSGGNTPNQSDADDLYVDLFELAHSLQISVTDAGVQGAAAAVAQGVDSFVIYQNNALAVQPLGGVGIFYPPDPRAPAGSASAAYLQDRLFSITPGWGWKAFLTSAPPDLIDPELEPMPDDLLLEPLPVAPLHPVYLPLVTR
jgi:hypothetical protein